jgi:hypothetical protein
VPKIRGLSYRLSATYSFADRGPYVVGQEQVYQGIVQPGGVPAYTYPQLLPLDRFRTAVGLQYDFP